MTRFRAASWLQANPMIAGSLAGTFAVLSWGASFALVRAGTNQGLHAVDFVMLR